MAHWGIALACGPHINLAAVSPPAAELAWTEINRAKKNAANATPVERALIDALSKRYANRSRRSQPAHRTYADAIGKYGRSFRTMPTLAFFSQKTDGLAALGSMDARRQAATGNR